MHLLCTLCFASSSSVDNDGNTPLHVAMKLGKKYVSNSIRKALIRRYKANLNLKNKQGMTPIHLAIISDEVENLDILKFIIKCNADIRKRDSKGNSYLHVACKHKRFDAATLFITHGLDPFQINNKGETPYQMAGKKLKNRDRLMNVLTVVYALERKLLKYSEDLIANTVNLDINISNDSGESPIHICCTNEKLYGKSFNLLLLKDKVCNVYFT